MKLVTVSGLLVKSYNALASGTMNDWYLSCMIESSVGSVSDCRTGDQKHFANSIVPKAAEASLIHDADCCARHWTEERICRRQQRVRLFVVHRKELTGNNRIVFVRALLTSSPDEASW